MTSFQQRLSGANHSATEAVSAPGPKPSSVVVAVLTYRRPAELAALLPVLLAQGGAVPASVSVLVVDNDPAGNGYPVVAELLRDKGTAGNGTTSAVRYVHEPIPGIAAARNRALDESAAVDLLVFIDDDERPVTSWLQAMLDLQAATGSAAVVGPVVSEFALEPDTWIVQGRFFDRRRLPTGTPIEVAATNNLLLDLSQVRRLGLRFDERFGLSGGSDTLFTRQLGRAGTLLWCDEAVVYDRVPAGRLTRRWVVLRAFRSGNSWGRTSLELSDPGWDRLRIRCGLTARGLLRAVGGAVQALAGLRPGAAAQQPRGVRTCARGLGMIAGAYGYVYSEYRRAEGRTSGRAQ